MTTPESPYYFDRYGNPIGINQFDWGSLSAFHLEGFTHAGFPIRPELIASTQEKQNLEKTFTHFSKLLQRYGHLAFLDLLTDKREGFCVRFHSSDCRCILDYSQNQQKEDVLQLRIFSGRNGHILHISKADCLERSAEFQKFVDEFLLYFHRFCESAQDWDSVRECVRNLQGPIRHVSFHGQKAERQRFLRVFQERSVGWEKRLELFAQQYESLLFMDG